MRTLIILFALSTFASLPAQPPIDTTWIPRPGDNFILQDAGYNQLPFNIYGDTCLALGGSNVTWDFSKLELQNTYDTVRYSGTTSDLVRTDMNGSVNLYWSGYQLYSPISGPYYEFPMDSSVTDTWGDNYNQFLTAVQYRGWGNLLLPGLHFENVLMLEQINSCSNEDIYTDDGGEHWPISALSQETDSYQWIVSYISNPVLTVNVSSSNQTVYHWSGEPGQSSEYTTTSDDTTISAWVYHYEFYSGVTNVALDNDLQLFPNPASEQLNLIIGRQDAATISIYNALGELVKQQKFSPVIDISELTSGYYILSIQFPEGTVMKQFVKL